MSIKKIIAISDIHGEFRTEKEMKGIARDIIAAKPDAIILAGDIHTGVQGARWVATEMNPGDTGVPVIMVSGNHEYYSRKIDTLDDKIRAFPEVTFLQNQSITIGGIRISGTTLWADGTGGKTSDDEIRTERGKMIQNMNDYKKIRIAQGGSRSYRKLTVMDTIRRHHQAIEFLENEAAQKAPEEPWIIVTHHAPTLKAFENHSYAEEFDYPHGAYASNLDERIQRWNPNMWIHGHIHEKAEITIGNTRIINVSRGYPDDEKSEYTEISWTK